MKSRRDPEFKTTSEKSYLLKQEGWIQRTAILMNLAALAAGSYLFFFPTRLESYTLQIFTGVCAFNLVFLFVLQYCRSKTLGLTELSYQDGLTGLSSRVHFELLLEDEIRRAGRYRYPLSICVLDLDSFASFNDSFGTTKGDDLLRKFSQFLKGNVRVSDVAGRFEEDAFAVFLPHTDLMRSQKFIARILMLSQERLDCSFSAGVTAYQAGENRLQFMLRASLALKQAKRDGKKRVCGVISSSDSDAAVINL